MKKHKIRRHPVFPRSGTALSLALALIVGDTASAQTSPPDPAPPEVHSLSPAIPKPTGFDRLTFHKAPSALAAGARTQDWPHLLGPAYDRASTETPLLETWPESGPAIVWEIERGMGHAAPVIAGEYLVFIHRLDGNEVIECVHPETGRRYWTHGYPVPFQQSYGVNDSPRASPTIDGDYVYTLGVASHFHCIHLPTGTVIWKRDLGAEFGVPHGFFGKGSSPLALGDNVILNLGADDGPCVAAFEKRTGKLAWETPHAWGGSYASPVPATLHGETRVLVYAGGQSNPPHGGLLCIDPSNGALNASVPWRTDMFASAVAASPVVFGDRAFITEAYGKGGALIEFAADFSATIAGTAPGFGCQFSTPIHFDGFLYGIEGSSDPGATLVCYNASSGKEVWRDRKISVGRGNLLRVPGAVLCLGEHGEWLRLELSPKGARVLVESNLFRAPETYTPPVLSGGLLYICQSQPDPVSGTVPRLLCYDLRGTEQ